MYPRLSSRGFRPCSSRFPSLLWRGLSEGRFLVNIEPICFVDVGCPWVASIVGGSDSAALVTLDESPLPALWPTSDVISLRASTALSRLIMKGTLSFPLTWSDPV